MNRPLERYSLLKPAWVYPFILAVSILGFYGFYLTPLCFRFTLLTWDAFRDLITAQHVLAGGSPFDDPAYKGYAYWYPPTHAVWLAGWATLLDWDIFRIYSLSPVVFGWIGFPAVYALTWRLTRCHHSAFLATLSLSSMPWFVTYVMAQPTVMAHATGPALLLLLWNVRLQNGENRFEFSVFSLCVGAMASCHPPTFVILFSVIALNLVGNSFLSRERKSSLIRLGLFLSLSLIAASPYGLVTLAQPIRNPVPMRYIAPGLYRWEMVLPGTSWWRCVPFLVLTVIGVWGLTREKRAYRSVFLWSLLIVSIAGQLPAYAIKALQVFAPDLSTRVERSIPVIVPHEFQLYGQIALCLLAGYGFRAGLQFSKNKRNAVLIPVLIYLSVVLACSLWELKPPSPSVPGRSQIFLWKYRLAGEWEGVVNAIRNHTDVSDVICVFDDRTSFFTVAVHTGRKCLSTYASHSNMQVDLESRMTARNAIFSAGTKTELLRYAQPYEVDYLLCHLQTVPLERIHSYQSWFKTVYDDGVVFLFSLNEKS